MPVRKITFENNNYYHIYNRGVEKRNIITSNYDIMRILESLEVFNTTESVGSIYEKSFNKRKTKLGGRATKLVEIIAFNILDNHYHLILRQLVDGGISKFMHAFGTGYVRHFNEKYKRSGALFQGPFKAEHIGSDEYLNYVVTYVNTNHLIHGYESLGGPATKWGMRSSLEQYVYSKKEWKNLYFECDMEIIKSRFKSGKEYLEDAVGIAKIIRDKRKGEKEDLVAGPPSEML